jgi:hypothetical protein
MRPLAIMPGHQGVHAEGGEVHVGLGHGREQRAGVLEGHMQQLHARGAGHGLHRHLAGVAVAQRRITHLARHAARRVQHVLQRAETVAPAHPQQEGGVEQQAQRRQVLGHVIGQRGVQERVDGQRGRVGHNRVWPSARRAAHVGERDDARRTGLVVHHHRLAHSLDR